MKRYIRSASVYTANFTSNDEWCEYLTRKLRLSGEDEELLIHDLNNLRGGEWIEVLEGRIPKKDLEQFKKFIKFYDEDDDDVEGATRIAASHDWSKPTPTFIQEGLFWDEDGHDIRVTQMLPGKKCKVTETWIGEDTGRENTHVATYTIADDPVNSVISEYIYDPKYGPEYRYYAANAFNYPWEDDVEDVDRWAEDEYVEEDDYTPSASRGDYSPSNPWDAPGMSMKDFI